MFIRKPNRLTNKELYKKNNRYFVTICTHKRLEYFWNIETITDGHEESCFFDGEQCSCSEPYSPLQLNKFGLIVENVWNDLPNMFTNIILDKYVVMPNHFHWIIWFNGQPKSSFTNKDTDLWKIIKRFKLETIREIKNSTKLDISLRQKSYYDHIIRNEKDLQRIQEYIINNPLKRKQDILNKENNDLLK